MLHRVVALAMVALLLGAGCAQKQTFVYGADLHLGLRQLKATGAAQVSTASHVEWNGSGPIAPARRNVAINASSASTASSTIRSPRP